MRCAESLRAQAYFDAEVDAVSASAIESHIEHCAECRALLQDLEQVRTVLRQDALYARTPPALRGKVMFALDQEDLPESPAATEGTPVAMEGTPIAQGIPVAQASRRQGICKTRRTSARRHGGD